MNGRKPLLLDLFCGAGGAAKGYQRAGFYVVGVDIKPQPRYAGDEFCQADALTVARWIEYGRHVAFLGNRRMSEFEAFHASPPCQAFTKARKLQGNDHPDLIAPIRDSFLVSEKPWVIENVPLAPLRQPITELCGMMFGLDVYRHRWFEASFPLPLILHPPHHVNQVKMGRPAKEGDVIQVVGHFSNVPYGRKAMGMPWATQGELAEAIPPAYTEWIGTHLMTHLRGRTHVPSGVSDD